MKYIPHPSAENSCGFIFIIPSAQTDRPGKNMRLQEQNPGRQTRLNLRSKLKFRKMSGFFDSIAKIRDIGV